MDTVVGSIAGGDCKKVVGGIGIEIEVGERKWDERGESGWAGTSGLCWCIELTGVALWWIAPFYSCLVVWLLVGSSLVRLHKHPYQ